MPTTKPTINPNDKFVGGYWSFAIYSNNIFWMLLLCAFALLTYVGGFLPDMPWWGLLSFIPFLLICYLNYTSWRERQKGLSS